MTITTEQIENTRKQLSEWYYFNRNHNFWTQDDYTAYHILSRLLKAQGQPDPPASKGEPK